MRQDATRKTRVTNCHVCGSKLMHGLDGVIRYRKNYGRNTGPIIARYVVRKCPKWCHEVSNEHYMRKWRVELGGDYGAPPPRDLWCHSVSG